MISAVIFHTRREPALALTLSRLVEGVLDGMLNDVSIIDPTHDPLAEKLADEGGCALLRGEAPFRDALRLARGDWLLLIPSGVAPARGWTSATRDALALAAAGGGDVGRLFPARREGLGPAARLIEMLRAPPVMALTRRDLVAQADEPDPLAAATRALRKAGARPLAGVAVDERMR